MINNLITQRNFNFSENNIQAYYNQNKESFIDTYKTINFSKLNTKILSGSEEFNDLFFQKIDEIDDLIVEGKDLEHISKKYNLESPTSFTIDGQGIDIKTKNKINFPDELINKIITINNEDPILLIDNKEEYFIFELRKIEKIQKKINDQSVTEEILTKLEEQTKRKIISEIMLLNTNFLERFIIFRPHNVYGPNMGYEHVIPEFINRFKKMKKKSKKFIIKGNGNETRSFIFIDDFISSFDLILKKGKHLNIYNIGTTERIKIRNLAIKISKFFKKKIILHKAKIARGGTRHRCPNISKIAKLGFKKKYNLNAGLSKTINWYN